MYHVLLIWITYIKLRVSATKNIQIVFLISRTKTLDDDEHFVHHQICAQSSQQFVWKFVEIAQRTRGLESVGIHSSIILSQYITKWIHASVCLQMRGNCVADKMNGANLAARGVMKNYSDLGSPLGVNPQSFSSILSAVGLKVHQTARLVRGQQREKIQ